MKNYFALQKKEILIYTTVWINLEDIVQSEISHWQERSVILFHLYELPKVVKLIETESSDYQSLIEG